jgi:AcrR family transcriptional regulator
MDSVSSAEKVNRKEQAERSAGAIVKAAFDVIAANSISGTSTSKIASEAGVSKPLLHYYFKNKEEILGRVLEDVLSKLLEIPLENANKKLSAFEEIKGIFRRYKETITSNPDLLVVFYDFWVRGAKMPEIRKSITQRFDAFRGYIGQLVTEGVSKGDFKPEKSHMLPPLMISFLEGASIQLITDPDAFNYDLYQYMALDMIAGITGAKNE